MTIKPAAITGRDSTARYSAMRGPTAAWRAMAQGGPHQEAMAISLSLRSRLLPPDDQEGNEESSRDGSAHGQAQHVASGDEIPDRRSCGSDQKSIDCTETASNLTQTVVIRLQLSVSGISDECRRLCAGEYPMNSSSADFSTILDRILDTAADNLRIAKILVQMGLDPNNITYDALFNRLLEIVLANITLANMFALVGAIFLVATLLMHTIVPLRVANMVGCMFFVAYGALSGNVGAFFLYLLLLPINAIRLRQMLNLIKRARIATEGDTSLEWLKPFMTERRYRRVDKLFKKDDAASEMFLRIEGSVVVSQTAFALPPH